MASNKLGDMLAEFNDPNVSISRKSEIKRYLNELGDREEKYKGWLDVEGKPKFNNPQILDPKFATNALSAAHFNRTTDIAITTGVDTPVTFEYYGGRNDAFTFTLDDPTKIQVVYSGQAFALFGWVTWEGNATGYRNVKIEFFDNADSSIASVPLAAHAGWSGQDNIFTFNIGIAQDQLSSLKYFKLTTGHTRGADLNLLSLFATAMIL